MDNAGRKSARHWLPSGRIPRQSRRGDWPRAWDSIPSLHPRRDHLIAFSANDSGSFTIPRRIVRRHRDACSAEHIENQLPMLRECHRLMSACGRGDRHGSFAKGGPHHSLAGPVSGLSMECPSKSITGSILAPSWPVLRGWFHAGILAEVSSGTQPSVCHKKSRNHFKEGTVPSNAGGQCPF